VTLFLALDPLTAALLGALSLGEPLGKRQLAGLVLITFGFWLTRRSRRPLQR
jgi:drug/metabolite transporter (DMT)-like permease